jgi:hypothetical protein
MTVPTRTPLGASTVNRKWYLDVQTDDGSSGSGGPTWTPVMGITEFQPQLEPGLQDDGDFDGEGYGSQTVTTIAWSVTGKCARKVTAADATAYDDGQEFIRLAAQHVGVANSVHVRFYEMPEDGPRVEAYEGDSAVTWSPDGGGLDALAIVSFTLTGQGKRKSIDHPDAA